jgi:hypothetical protein
VVIGKGAYLVNRVELRVRAVDVREVGFKKILHHLQVGIFLVDVHLVAEQVGVYFCKRKGSVHLLGVYWTCIGRVLDDGLVNSHRNRSEHSPVIGPNSHRRVRGKT